MPDAPITTTCCIAGGGPAGIMLGVLLARAGVPVIVVEKHADFFRDFRGDTIHPSTVDRSIALMPQWDFLSLLVEEGARHPELRLMMGPRRPASSATAKPCAG